MGQDTLALLHPEFDVRTFVKVFDKHENIGLLDWTFGSDTAHLSFVLDKLSPTLVRIHLLNSVCSRNRNCGNYEAAAPFDKNALNQAVLRRNARIIGFVTTRTEVYRELAKGYPRTKFLVSPALEHDLTPKAWRILADTIKNVWPDVQLVNSPDGGIPAEAYRGALIERHGDKPQADASVNSLDGVDGSTINIKSWVKTNGKIKLYWRGTYNCRAPGAFIDPRKRHSCPPVSDFISAYDALYQ